MVTLEEARQFALSFEGTVESPHFHKTSFRVRKKIFMTMDEQTQLACVFLSLVDQSAFSAYDKDVMYPVPNAWGKQGATYINLKKVKKTMFRDAVRTSHDQIISKMEKKKPLKKRIRD